ncbi:MULTISPECIES: helix-turn-helix domain-containing protein [Actinokineospora]|uniref:LuxR family transcriptional regulator n=1 Tax=Actinokineospora fastidiosa TaxID=1816 RepID=A0A918LGD6_9PSEU|nr:MULTISPECIES: helix-turn-helix domain-containing protein [Actinokineospora]UVS78545.1 Sugar-specific transcriptional regulator TrmB [Actinokineospora sp. UTMC 2448]GGS45222.1 LuxR family transcriptional regulator [Actinokineospora fastidiosa]
MDEFDPGFLEPIGLGVAEGALYLRLLRRPRAEASELAAALGVSSGGLSRAMGNLIEAGLATRLPGRPARYVPAPPQVALDALTTRRAEQLDRLRGVTRDLAAMYEDAPRGEPGDLVELIEGGPAVRHHIAQIQLAARQEVLLIDCPPYLGGAPEHNVEELQGLRRGVVYRTIYQTPAPDDRARLAEITAYTEAGEDARTLPDVQMKMMIADRRMALIPLSFEISETGSRILVHRSPLLDALIACFDMLWERATPIGPALRSGHRDRELLTLLASGMKDAAIMRSLGITQRTMTRRMSALLDELGATTRFQAGIQANRRGLV